MRTEILAVGDMDSWRQQAPDIRNQRLVKFLDLVDVTADLLEVLRPQLVVSPLLARNFDCFDLARHLAKLRYGGAYRAIAHGLPAPAMVRREIRALCPSLDFDVMEWPEGWTGDLN